MKAVILSGGRGEKMAPFSLTRPKALIPVAARPLILWTLDALRKAGVHEVAIVENRSLPRIAQVVGDGTAVGLSVTYRYQAEAKGSAEALLAASDFIDDDFLVIFGDVFTRPENISAMVHTFQKSDAECVVGLGKRDFEVVRHSFGALLDSDGRIRHVSWRPLFPEAVWVAGIFVFRVSALDVIRRNPGMVLSVRHGMMGGQEADLHQSVHDLAQAGRHVHGHYLDDPIVDLDFPWDIRTADWAAREWLFSSLGKNELGENTQIDPSAQLQGPIRAGKNVTIGRNVVIEGPVIIGDDTVLRNGALIRIKTVIGERCVLQDYCAVGGSIGSNMIIGHTAEFSGVFFGNGKCNEYCNLGAVVVGEAVDFGAGTVCGNHRFDSEPPTIRIKGRAYRPPQMSVGGYFGDYCRTGVNAMIMPGVRVGPYSVVGPGVVLYKDLASGKLALVKQELVIKDWGPERYGW